MPYEKKHDVPNIYFDRTFGRHAARILPGEYFACDRDLLIVTVLGSCVSVCLRDRCSGVGGMNHFMLPMCKSDSGNPADVSARYGVHAMELLINGLLKMGALHHNLESKVFGGGRVLQRMTDVGKSNARFALEFLHTENIPVLATDLGSVYPRKVVYSPRTGQVFVRLLRNRHISTIAHREKTYLRHLDVGRLGEDIEWFD